MKNASLALDSPYLWRFEPRQQHDDRRNRPQNTPSPGKHTPYCAYGTFAPETFRSLHYRHVTHIITPINAKNPKRSPHLVSWSILASAVPLSISPFPLACNLYYTAVWTVCRKGPRSVIMHPRSFYQTICLNRFQPFSAPRTCHRFRFPLYRFVLADTASRSDVLSTLFDRLGPRDSMTKFRVAAND